MTKIYSGAGDHVQSAKVYLGVVTNTQASNAYQQLELDIALKMWSTDTTESGDAVKLEVTPVWQRGQGQKATFDLTIGNIAPKSTTLAVRYHI